MEDWCGKVLWVSFAFFVFVLHKHSWYWRNYKGPKRYRVFPPMKHTVMGMIMGSGYSRSILKGLCYCFSQ